MKYSKTIISCKNNLGTTRSIQENNEIMQIIKNSNKLLTAENNSLKSNLYILQEKNYKGITKSSFNLVPIL